MVSEPKIFFIVKNRTLSERKELVQQMLPLFSHSSRQVLVLARRRASEELAWIEVPTRMVADALSGAVQVLLAGVVPRDSFVGGGVKHGRVTGLDVGHTTDSSPSVWDQTSIKDRTEPRTAWHLSPPVTFVLIL